MVVDLGNSPDVTANQVGGKAAGLYRLAEDGFPVPPAWVVPTAALNSHVTNSGGIDANVNHGIDIDSGMLEGIRKEILETPMARLLEDDIKSLPASTWAVRSSARTEDSSRASYSGLFRTVLGVSGAEDIISAVKTVWGSVFLPEALAYHSRFSQEPLSQMAVLLMPMVDAISAGVAASANPVTGNPFRVVISACRGLGTTVVAGGRNCDRHTLDLDSL
jgi:pyruvate,water dikinase